MQQNYTLIKRLYNSLYNSKGQFIIIRDLLFPNGRSEEKLFPNG